MPFFKSSTSKIFLFFKVKRIVYEISSVEYLLQNASLNNKTVTGEYGYSKLLSGLLYYKNNLRFRNLCVFLTCEIYINLTT